MIAQCPQKIDCPGTDFPFLNASSEGPDVLTYIGINYGFNDPSLLNNFKAYSCVGVCESSISQEEADRCAANNAYLCINGGQNVPDDPNNPNPQIFFNRAQTCVKVCKDGLPFTFTIPAGAVAGPSQAIADSQAYQDACTLASGRMICLSNLNKTAVGGLATYNDSIRASGAFLARPPYTDSWTVTGDIPNGLTFNGGDIQGGSVTITGIPNKGGTFFFTVQIIDPLGDYQRKTYSIRVVNIETSTLPNGTHNVPYHAALTSQGGKTPLSWQIDSGALPLGITINEQTGVISGTPTTYGVFTFDVLLQDEAT